MKNACITEFRRLWAAFGYSIDGLKVAWQHPPFRIEVLVICIMLPLGLLLGGSGVSRAMLSGSLLLVPIVELLNTGLETAINRISFRSCILSPNWPRMWEARRCCSASSMPPLSGSSYYF